VVAKVETDALVSEVENIENQTVQIEEIIEANKVVQPALGSDEKIAETDFSESNMERRELQLVDLLPLLNLPEELEAEDDDIEDSLIDVKPKNATHGVLRPVYILELELGLHLL